MTPVTQAEAKCGTMSVVAGESSLYMDRTHRLDEMTLWDVIV